MFGLLTARGKIIVKQVYSWTSPSAAFVSVNWVSIGSGNDLSPVQCQIITWTNADLLSIGSLQTDLSEIWTEIQNFSCIKIHLKMSSGKWWPFWPREDKLTSYMIGQYFSKIIKSGTTDCTSQLRLPGQQGITWVQQDFQCQVDPKGQGWGWVGSDGCVCEWRG